MIKPKRFCSGCCAAVEFQAFPGWQRPANAMECILARPLLDYAKTELVAFCEMKAQPFIDDPSNHDPAFARTRIRRLNRFLAEKGLDRKALLRLGHRAARADAALDTHARTVTAALEVQRGLAVFRANISVLANEPEEILLRFLANELKLINGDKPLRFDRLEAIAHSVSARHCVAETPIKRARRGHIAPSKQPFFGHRPEGARQRGRETHPRQGMPGPNQRPRARTHLAIGETRLTLQTRNSHYLYPKSFAGAVLT